MRKREKPSIFLALEAKIELPTATPATRRTAALHNMMALFPLEDDDDDDDDDDVFLLLSPAIASIVRHQKHSRKKNSTSSLKRHRREVEMGTKFSTTAARNQRLILVSYASVKSTARARATLSSAQRSVEVAAWRSIVLPRRRTASQKPHRPVSSAAANCKRKKLQSARIIRDTPAGTGSQKRLSYH